MGHEHLSRHWTWEIKSGQAGVALQVKQRLLLTGVGWRDATSRAGVVRKRGGGMGLAPKVGWCEKKQDSTVYDLPT
jgi:hypothetical protein